MVTHANGRAASLLDSAGPGTSRPAPHRPHTPHKVHPRDDALVVRVPLCERPFELRVPRAAVKARRHQRRHIPGFNPDSTPC
jgi:hypothetical protein